MPKPEKSVPSRSHRRRPLGCAGTIPRIAQMLSAPLCSRLVTVKNVPPLRTVSARIPRSWALVMYRGPVGSSESKSYQSRPPFERENS